MKMLFLEDMIVMLGYIFNIKNDNRHNEICGIFFGLFVKVEKFTLNVLKY